MALKILAIAAATGRIGYTYLVGGKLKDWGISKKASQSTENAAEQTQAWINQYQPDVVVTEKITEQSRKGKKSQSLIAAIANVAEHNYLLDVSVEKLKQFKDKYLEAEALAERFPLIKAWVPPKRLFWNPEPKNTILFEALGFAVQVIDRPK